MHREIYIFAMSVDENGDYISSTKEKAEHFDVCIHKYDDEDNLIDDEEVGMSIPTLEQAQKIYDDRISKDSGLIGQGLATV